MTTKVKAWGEGQGEFVEIDDGAFNPDIHELYENSESAAKSEVATENTAEQSATPRKARTTKTNADSV